MADPLADRVRRLVLQNSIEHGGAARPGPVLARLLATEPALRPRSAEVGELIRSTIDSVAPLSADQRAAELARLGGPEADRGPAPKDSGGEFPELPGAEHGRVVLRMAPFPSGALHIGNGRMIFVNDFYRRRYSGKLLLVFDDTIGSVEKRLDPDTFEIIERDLELCDAKPDAVYYKSDLIPHHYPWARRVIEAKGAYVCVCPQEILRTNRAAGIACAEREQDTGTALDGWDKMLGGGFAPGEAVLRLRTDLADPDPAFRDRVLFRISDIEHPRVGHKFRVWPLLEFSWAVDDIELGVTHVIRGKDLVMEDRMQRFLWDLLGLRGPPFLHWGLLRVREAKISKSKSYAEVKSGAYDGWADPRTWSFRSLDRRGITTDATRQFTLSFGLSLADIEVPAETLYAE
ncbi:MAG: glutamate--tRNA ligase family protein, partial [Thermoplasmata archaeon]|nr:glutamate--tRNA ligase family protein [Thermoplasmata archaeon]